MTLMLTSKPSKFLGTASANILHSAETERLSSR